MCRCDSEVCEGQLVVAVASRTLSRYVKLIRVTLSVSDVNDHAPRFEPPSVVVDVSEQSQPGKTVALPSTAVDEDAGENARLSFEVRWNGSVAAAAGKLDFRVSEATGGRLAIELVVVGRLDRESEEIYTATVTAVDAGTPPRSGTLNVTVRVTDANDNVPVFESELYETTIREDLAPGSTVARPRAVDPDAGDNGAVRYRLSGQSSDLYGDLFQVDERTGDVTLRRRIDSSGVYRLTVVAVDRGPDAVVVETQVVVHVVDVNNHAPVIRLAAGRRLEVLENKPPNTLVRVH